MTIKTVDHFRYLGDSVPAIIIMVSLFVFPSRRRDKGEFFFYINYTMELKAFQTPLAL